MVFVDPDCNGLGQLTNNALQFAFCRIFQLKKLICEFAAGIVSGINKIKT